MKNRIAFLYVTLGLLIQNSSLLGVSLDRKIIDVGVGLYQTCFLLAAPPEIRCWGDAFRNSAPPQDLKSPVRIVLSGNHGCLLDEGRVRCWGWNDDGQATPPKLDRPTELAVGDRHSCAVNGGSVKCWGQNQGNITKPPALQEPRLLAAGGKQTCAVDKTAIHCWGGGYPTQGGGYHIPKWEVPKFKNVTALSVGEYGACAIGDGIVKCWGNETLERVPPLKAPTKVSVAGSSACALTGEGLQCWGTSEDIPGKPPRIQKADFLVSGGHHVCAVEGTDAICWGYNSNGQLGVPGPSVKFEDMQWRHSQFLGKLSPEFQKKLTTDFPKSKVMDHCGGRFGFADKRDATVVTLIQQEGRPNSFRVNRVVLESGKQSVQATKLGSGEWAYCHAKGSACFLGDTLCLPPSEARVFLKKNAIDILKPKSLAKTDRDTVCLATHDTYNNWDCFTAAEKPYDYNLSARAARAD